MKTLLVQVEQIKIKFDINTGEEKEETTYQWMTYYEFNQCLPVMLDEFDKISIVAHSNHEIDEDEKEMLAKQVAKLQMKLDNIRDYLDTITDDLNCASDDIQRSLDNLDYIEDECDYE